MSGWRTQAFRNAMHKAMHMIVGAAPLTTQGLLTVTVTDELELLAKDCEDTARAVMKLTLAATNTAESTEAYAWLLVAHRIRHVAKRLTHEDQ